jgi:hypothetical protein
MEMILSLEVREMIGYQGGMAVTHFVIPKVTEMI